MIEFRSNLRPEEPASSTLIHSPSFDIIRVGPHQIAEGTFVGNLHATLNQTNLVHCLDIWGKTSVDTEYFAFNNSSDAEIVEYLSAILPRICVSVLSDSLIVETIDSGDLSGFMVASQESDVGWVLQFQTKQQLEGLH